MITTTAIEIAIIPQVSGKITSACPPDERR